MRTPWPTLVGGGGEELECGVDVFELCLRSLFQILVALKTVGVPDLDEEAIRFSDLSFGGIHPEIEGVEGGAAGAASALILNRIAAHADVHDALPEGLVDGTIIEETLWRVELLRRKNQRFLNKDSELASAQAEMAS